MKIRFLFESRCFSKVELMVFGLSCQVHDYLINLKLEGGCHMLHHLRQLTALFLILGDRTYAVANIINLRMLMYHESLRSSLPFMYMFVNDICMFSEESGELSFSALSCVTLGDHASEKSKFLDKMYKSLHMYWPFKEGLTDQFESYRSQQLQEGQKADAASVDVCSHFFRRKLCELSRGCFKSYASTDCLLRKNPSFSTLSTVAPVAA